MSLAFGIGVYIVFWWLVFFTILPIGVTTQDEAGEVSPGTTESAPVKPRLLLKVLLTTLVATLIFGVFYAVMEYGLLSLDDIPFLPKYDTYLKTR